MHSNKPTEVDSMNRLRVEAEDKARAYRDLLVRMTSATSISHFHALLCEAKELLSADGMSGTPAPLTDERLLNLWDTHVGYETGFKGSHLSNKDKIAFARAVLYAQGVRANRAEPFSHQTPMEDTSSGKTVGEG